MNETKLSDQALILNGFLRCILASFASGVGISLLLCLIVLILA